MQGPLTSLIVLPSLMCFVILRWPLLHAGSDIRDKTMTTGEDFLLSVSLFSAFAWLYDSIGKHKAKSNE